MTTSRRQLLTGGAGLLAAGLLSPGLARAFGPTSRVDIAELDLGMGTKSRPNAWKRLLFEVVHTTSVECEAQTALVKPEDPALFAHPFLVLLGDQEFELPGDEGMEQLSRYLAYGGFLLIDDTTGSDRGGFDTSARELCDALFPTRPLSPLPSDHAVQRSFFLLRHPVGRLALHDHLEAVVAGTSAPIVYCRNDLSGALERGPDGRHPNACVPGGESQRREAVKLGVNLVLYALTSNYKQDIAHVRTLIEEGRIE